MSEMSSYSGDALVTVYLTQLKYPVFAIACAKLQQLLGSLKTQLMVELGIRYLSIVSLRLGAELL